MVIGDVIGGNSEFNATTCGHGLPAVVGILKLIVAGLASELAAVIAPRNCVVSFGLLSSVLVTVNTWKSLNGDSNAPRSGAVPTMRGLPSRSVDGEPCGTRIVPELTAGEA